MYIFINQQIIIVNLIIYIQLTGFIKKWDEDNLNKEEEHHRRHRYVVDNNISCQKEAK